jgi:hypothetical protein
MTDHTRTGARRSRYSWNRRAAIGLGDDVCGLWLFPPPGRRGRITAATAASNLTLWLVLLACLRGTGLSQAQVPWQTSEVRVGAQHLHGMRTARRGIGELRWQ